MVRLAIDCMGGDRGLEVTVPAALSMLQRDAQAAVILVGVRERIERELERLGGADGDRLSVQHAPEIVAMDEAPAAALRTKKESSMRIALELVAQGTAAACVSAGNTGALMAISRFVLGTLPGVDRPAIATVLPTLRGRTYMLDLGANVNCTPEQLLEFGVMGAELASALERKPRPTVGLLNVGVEDVKGNELVKRAAELLRASGLNFYGYVEGDDIYRGTTDVVVCDGFVGNVALKTSEGLAQMLSTFLHEEFAHGPFARVAALVAWPVLARFRRRVDPRRYNGASLLGLRGIVVKSHGAADALAFESALARALEEVRSGMLGHIAERMAAIHESAA